MQANSLTSSYKLKLLAFTVSSTLSLAAIADTFDGYTENSIFDQPNNVSHTFINNLTVNGSWNMLSVGNPTDMFFSGAQLIGGTGFINMSDTTANRMYSSSDNLLTIGNDMTVRGAGQIGINVTHVDNKGTILAEGASTLTIDSGNFINNDVLNAEGGGVNILAGAFINSGNVNIAAGSKINRTGTFVQTAGQTNVNGTLISGEVILQGGGDSVR